MLLTSEPRLLRENTLRSLRERPLPLASAGSDSGATAAVSCLDWSMLMVSPEDLLELYVCPDEAVCAAVDTSEAMRPVSVSKVMTCILIDEVIRDKR